MNTLIRLKERCLHAPVPGSGIFKPEKRFETFKMSNGIGLCLQRVFSKFRYGCASIRRSVDLWSLYACVPVVHEPALHSDPWSEPLEAAATLELRILAAHTCLSNICTRLPCLLTRLQLSLMLCRALYLMYPHQEVGREFANLTHAFVCVKQPLQPPKLQG